MEHHLDEYRRVLQKRKLYVSNSDFIDNVGWRGEGSSYVLTNKDTNANAVATAVGRVSENRCLCEGHGNFQNRDYGTLAGAKFQFQLSRPDDTVFASDFDKAVETLKGIQDLAAITGDRRYLLEMDHNHLNIRFTWNIFQKRVCRRSLHRCFA